MALKYPCPKCKNAGVPFKEKFLAGHWKTIHCEHCGARLANNPIVQALFYFMHVWNISFFLFMAMWEKDWLYVLIMMVIWIILEFFAYYIPLVSLKAKPDARS